MAKEPIQFRVLAYDVSQVRCRQPCYGLDTMCTAAGVQHTCSRDRAPADNPTAGGTRKSTRSTSVLWLGTRLSVRGVTPRPCWSGGLRSCSSWRLVQRTMPAEFTGVLSDFKQWRRVRGAAHCIVRGPRGVATGARNGFMLVRRNSCRQIHGVGRRLQGR